MQSGLLFQALYKPNSDTYFIQTVFKIEGEVDGYCLKLAWQKACDLHPILRTGFIWQYFEKPLQFVLTSSEIDFRMDDWQNLTDAEQENRLQIFIKKDRELGFKLGKAPLFRVCLIQRRKNKYYLIWSLHHLLLDGWCLSIVLGDVFKTYKNIRQGKEHSSNLCPPPYRDYIAWLLRQDRTTAEKFWKEYLADIDGPTSLNFQNLIQNQNEKDYASTSILLSVEETEKITLFAKKNYLTLNTVIQGALGVVLKQYSGKQEVIMGVTVSGRDIDLPRVEEMIGVFINTLPLRINFKFDTIGMYLKNIQENAQKLQRYAYVSLAEIQSWANVD